MVVEVQSQLEIRLKATEDGVTFYQAHEWRSDQAITIHLEGWDDFLHAIQGAYMKSIALREIEEKGKMDPTPAWEKDNQGQAHTISEHDPRRAD